MAESCTRVVVGPGEGQKVEIDSKFGHRVQEFFHRNVGKRFANAQALKDFLDTGDSFNLIPNPNYRRARLSA